MDERYPPIGGRPLSVSELNEYVRQKLAGDLMLRTVRVRGEISGWKAHVSGHCYFTLKDASARVACAMFRMYAQHLSFTPQDGMRVMVVGSASLYAVNGSYQLYVESILREGVDPGAQRQAFEALKEKLAREGALDTALKKPLPLLPRRVGVVTSATGAAFRDIVRVIRARVPHMDIVLCPATVQGDGAAPTIAAAIERLDRYGNVDVMLVGRGGGSVEDLWPFNEETVARAILACTTPVVSCVGHEIDYTIADFVADVRAATPSNAAELATPVASVLRAQMAQMARRLTHALRAQQDVRRAHLRALARTAAIQRPREWLLDNRRRALEVARERLIRAMQRRMADARQRLALREKTLAAFHPSRVLDRGYAVLCHPSGAIVDQVEALQAGETIIAHMRGGTVELRVVRTNPGTDSAPWMDGTTAE